MHNKPVIVTLAITLTIDKSENGYSTISIKTFKKIEDSNSAMKSFWSKIFPSKKKEDGFKDLSKVDKPLSRLQDDCDIVPKSKPLKKFESYVEFVKHMNEDDVNLEEYIKCTKQPFLYTSKDKRYSDFAFMLKFRKSIIKKSLKLLEDNTHLTSGFKLISENS